MRILHINTYQTGGAALACRRLHRQLLQEGVESDLLVLFKTKDEERVYDFRKEVSALRNMLNKFKHKSHQNLQLKLLKKHGLDELFSPNNTTWQVHDHPLVASADIIHLNWVESFIDYSTFFQKVKKPIVWSAQDYAPFTDGFHYPTEGSFQERLDLEEIKSAAFDTANITAVSPSKFVADKMRNSNLFGRFDCHHLVNVFPTSIFNIERRTEARERIGLESNKPVVLFAAERFDYKRKGWDLIKDQIPQIREKYHFVCVGSNEVESDTTLSLINSEEKLADVYASADVLLMPTRNDNLPNMPIESILCGTPVISHRVGGLPEIINEDNGLLLAPETRIEVAHIDQLLSKNMTPESIALEAQRIYDPKSAVSAHIKLYSKILATNL